MQKLNLSDEEKLSRKEYLKKKKKQSIGIIGKNKKKYIAIFFATILMLYVFIQFYIYYKENNYKYLSDNMVDEQTVYNMYYVSIGYTYTPKSSLNSIKSNGFEEVSIYKDLGFSHINPNGEYIYGIKDTSISKLNKQTNEVTVVYEKDVNKYTMYNNEIYAIVGSNNKLVYIDSTTNESKDLGIENITEILVDENNLFLCIYGTDKKSLVRINKDGTDKKVLTGNENVSYIVQNDTMIFFVNKADSNKVYSMKKDGTDIVKVADIQSVTDTGTIQDVDGSKYIFTVNNNLYYINTEDKRNLWKINLDDKTTEKIISMSVDILEKVDNTVFYKVQDEKGIYLFNLDTKFTSQVSSRLITEFVVNK
ncbi:MAG: DUF5050 domain-containing protein [Clostridia bacterium]|nr:DUF5050 domain-containing protein [Clostridia bacterium]MDD4386570.1 DUF5050 domain-containing protein [Clostridia bacterium]